ncbi:hypothetical protein AB1Y20_014225 [Prymnesium parvum]|uniref:Uncharacterized protein n=1 Tax=Prymnesium parvum TaxID=97485 RepID=A0AB34ID36_PRYPA
MLCPLEDDEELVLLNERVEVRDDTRVLWQRAQQVHFLEAAVARLSVHHVKDLDFLQRDALLVRLAHSAVHNAKVAAADRLLYNVVVETPTPFNAI